MDAVIVTHNSARDLEGLVGSATMHAAFDRLIVVDNASTDESIEMARAAGAEVVERGVNDAFGAAANEGARMTRGAAFCLLNPDIRFDRTHDVRRLARHLTQPNIGAVAPALVLPDGTLQDASRDIPTPMELIERRIRKSTSGARFNDGPADVPWAVGACLVLRREAFDAVGGFDESYRLYFEDVDLCVRMREAGWRIHSDGAVRVRHHHRAESRKSLTGWATRQHARSAAHFFRQHPAFLLRPSAPVLRPPVTFVAWSSRGERGREIAATLGGESQAYAWPAGGGPAGAAARYAVSAARTLAYCARRRPAALIVTSPPVFAPLTAYAYARVTKTPLVLDSHPAAFGAKDDLRWRLLLPLQRWLSRRAALSLVTVDELAQRVRDWGGEATPLHEAPPMWSVAPPAPLPPGGRPCVLAVTVFAGDEPIAELLDAARLAPELDVLVTGDPDRCPPALREAAPPNVTFTGYLVRDAYRAAVERADLMVVLTTAQTSVVRGGYEAVYARRPLVVSDTPALRQAFPLAVHVAGDAAAIAAGLADAVARHEVLRATSDAALELQRVRWEEQLSTLRAAIAPAVAR
jgi:GT2 family glycosyltransferase